MSFNNALVEELEVLKSIYNEDFRCDGSSITITLSPLQENEKKETYVQVDLCIICSETYPQKSPEVFLKNIKGLTNNKVEILYSQLKETAKCHNGEVMIYDLACCVQEFLWENNKPGKKSCYEEMLIRKELQRQEEDHKKTEMMKDLKKRKKEMLQLTENDSSDDEDFKDGVCDSSLMYPKIRSNSVPSEKIPCEHKNCKYVQFNNKILRGCCIEHNESSIIYCAIDSTTGEQLLLQEWTLKPNKKDMQTSELIKQKLFDFQNELGNLKKLCHENLSSYIDFNWCSEKGEWIVHILQENVTGVNLNVFIEKNLDLEINFIRYITLGVLKAVDYLHDHNIVHGCLNDCSIYLSKLGIVRVTNYGIKKMIHDLENLCKSEKLLNQSVQFSQKSDILEIGQLILKIMKFPSAMSKNVIVPEVQPPELKEFVEKCLIENEEERWTAKKLLNHKFLRMREGRLAASKKKLSDGGNLEINVQEIEKPYDAFFDGNQNVSSRLGKEFKILNHIGSGSFGKVLKVKNKLDDSVYAIKAIRLSLKNKVQDKKMIREVKLLSKLNHENVVRYYTSWIETDSDSDLDPKIDSFNKEVNDVHKICTTDKSNLIHESDEDDDDEDDDEDDNEDDEIGENEADKNLNNTGEKTESSYVVFLSEKSGKNKEDTSVESFPKPDRVPYLNRTMYIQMEFCEKSTLRIAINERSSAKLCEDSPRLWRLFREIVEGLAYVHEQGMIHRDLKPENIFLDSNDHVKIGDFGLATISAVSREFCTFGGASVGAGDDASSQNLYDDFHTGKVGTSLYVAPEVDKALEKSYYNEKVDVYSLGVIFFEMCHGPFNTDMERITTISNIRNSEISLPPSFNDKDSAQKNLVKMLLNHDPKSRPYCSEILEGDHLPPAEFEYEQFQEIMRQTLTNTKSKEYKYLVSSCFDQEVHIEDDVTYQWENARSEKQHFILGLIKDRTEKIFEKHGAIYLSAPLLLPQNRQYTNKESRVKLMTHSGSIVNLPYDLRIPFARYVASKRFTRLRRYVVERVFREKKVHGLHPKEQYECAFDLVTPTSGIENAELEILNVIQEIINDFTSLKNRNCVIRLNHCLLLKSVLMHVNSEKWYNEIFKILADAKESKYFRSKLELNLQQSRIHNGHVLLSLLTKEDSFTNIKKDLLSFVTKGGKTLDVLNKALDELNNIIVKAERLGIKVPIKIALGVVCESEYCSDLMFDVAYHVKQKKKKEETIVLMSGCRYDGLIEKFMKMFDLTVSGPEIEIPSAVGISIFLDKIAALLKEDNILSEYVVIFSAGDKVVTQAKEAVAQKLREAGIKCYVEDTIQTVEELSDFCRDNKINNMINLKDKESSIAMTWDNDKNLYVEKKINVREITDHILRNSSKGVEGYSSSVFVRQFSEPPLKSAPNDFQNGISFNTQIISEEKLGPRERKKYENQLRTKINSVASIFSSRIRLEVVGVFLEEQVMSDVALNFKTNNCVADMESIADRNSLKKYVWKICEKLRSLQTENSNTVIILYSLQQDKYHVIVDC